MKSKARHGNTMIAVEITLAEIDFADIFDATEVVQDNDFNETPWHNCDGFDHETQRLANVYGDYHSYRGYHSGQWNEPGCVITLAPGDPFGIFDHLRNQGATRQVAAEMVAAERRRTLAQLVTWYDSGWEWYGVRCRFEALGDEYHDSLWGIDDPEYAEVLKEEIALNVAAQLEEAGYTVTGKPEERQFPGRADKRAQLAQNLASQNWRADS